MQPNNEQSLTEKARAVIARLGADREHATSVSIRELWYAAPALLTLLSAQMAYIEALHRLTLHRSGDGGWIDLNVDAGVCEAAVDAALKALVEEGEAR